MREAHLKLRKNDKISSFENIWIIFYSNIIFLGEAYSGSPFLTVMANLIGIINDNVVEDNNLKSLELEDRRDILITLSSIKIK